MNTLIKALLGASMLVPVTAHAQRAGFDVDAKIASQDDGQDGARERPARHEQRGDRGDRGDGGGFAGDRDGRQRNTPAGGFQADASVAARADSGGFRRDDRRDGRPQPQDDRASMRNGRSTPDLSAVDRRDERGGFRASRDDDRLDYRRDAQREVAQDQARHSPSNYNRGWNGNGNARGDDRNRYVGQRGGNWNRGWHTDSRYDWTRYRSANRGAYRLPRYYAPYGWNRGYRRFSVGITLSSILWNENYWIDDPWSYRLPEAYGPYRWVRYYDDALLIDLRTGRVIDTVYDIFW